MPGGTPLRPLRCRPAGALNRAEWIKYLGLFFNKESQASDLFDAIVKEYDATKVRERERAAAWREKEWQE